MKSVKSAKKSQSCNHNGVFRWLLIYFTLYANEVRDYKKRVLPFLKKSRHSKTVGFDMISISRTNGGLKSANRGNDGYEVISYSPGQGFKTRIDPCNSLSGCITAMFDEQVKRHGCGYDGVMYSGHSNGFAMGYDKYQVLENVDFAKILRQQVKRVGKKFECLAFDSCFQGTLESLYDFRSVAKYIMASPSYHDHRSLIEAGNFFAKRSSESVLTWLKRITDSYVNKAERMSHIDYPIMNNIFSAPQLGKLGTFIYKNKLQNVLTFSKQTQVYHDDDSQHDLAKAMALTLKKDIPKSLRLKIIKAQNMMKKAVIYAPFNPKNKLAKHFPELTIHSYIPDYVDKSVACKPRLYKSTAACTKKLTSKQRKKI